MVACMVGSSLALACDTGGTGAMVTDLTGVASGRRPRKCILFDDAGTTPSRACGLNRITRTKEPDIAVRLCERDYLPKTEA